MTLPRPLTVQILSARCAALKVHETGTIRMTHGPLQQAPRGRVYDLYIGAQQQLQVRVPASIDQENLSFAWSDVASLLETKRPLPGELQRFLAGHGAPGTAALLDALPEGDYFLVRSPLKATRPAFLCVGNDAIPAPENVLSLLHLEDPPDAQGRELWLMAYILGAASACGPVRGQPMLGVTITRLTGSHTSFGLYFLPIGAGDPAAPAEEHLLIVPLRGALVIDTKHDAAQRFPESYPDLWQEPYGLRAAVFLAGTEPR